MLFLKVWVTPPITLQLPTHPVVFNLLSTAPDPPSSLPLEQAFSSHVHFYWPEPDWNLQLSTAAPSKSAPSSCKNRGSFHTGPKPPWPQVGKEEPTAPRVCLQRGGCSYGALPPPPIYIYYYFLAGEGRDFVLFLQQPSRALGIDFRAHERDFLQAFPVEGSSSKRWYHPLRRNAVHAIRSKLPARGLEFKARQKLPTSHKQQIH